MCPALSGHPGQAAGHPDDEGAHRAADRVVRTGETMRLLCAGRVAAVVDAVVERGSPWTVTEPVDERALATFLDTFREGRR